jgi:hypothetical protein
MLAGKDWKDFQSCFLYGCGFRVTGGCEKHLAQKLDFPILTQDLFSKTPKMHMS